jgi:hypothetical protein
VDSSPLYQRANGSLCDMDEDGYRTEYDDLDNVDTLLVKPTDIRDFAMVRPISGWMTGG